MPGYGLRTANLAVVMLLPAAVAFAQVGQTIEFSSPAPATIRQTSGVVARGQLLRITPTQVVIRNAKGKDLTLQMSTVRTLRTVDGELLFIPSQDTYDDLLKRASRLEYATVGSMASDDPQAPPTATGPRPNRPPSFALRGSRPPRPAGTEAADDAGGFANPGGFDGIDTAGFGPPQDLQPMAGRAEPRLPAVDRSEPTDSGDSAESMPPSTQSPPTGSESVIQESTPGYGSASPNQAQPTSSPAQPLPAPLAPASGAAPQSFSFSTMPLWAKVGFFGAMIGIFYAVVLRKW